MLKQQQQQKTIFWINGLKNFKIEKKIYKQREKTCEKNVEIDEEKKQQKSEFYILY